MFTVQPAQDKWVLRPRNHLVVVVVFVFLEKLFFTNYQDISVVNTGCL